MPTAGRSKPWIRRWRSQEWRRRHLWVTRLLMMVVGTEGTTGGITATMVGTMVAGTTAGTTEGAVAAEGQAGTRRFERIPDVREALIFGSDSIG